MIPMMGMLLWTLSAVAIGYIFWKGMVPHTKVYLLIIYNAIFLIGAFILFPFLKSFH